MFVCVIHPHFLSFLCFLFLLCLFGPSPPPSTPPPHPFQPQKLNKTTNPATMTPQTNLEMAKSIQPNSKQPITSNNNSDLSGMDPPTRALSPTSGH